MFKKTMSDNVSLSVDVARILNREILITLNRLHSFTTKHAHGRLAELLLYLQHEVYQSNPFYLTLSKSVIAELLATSKESVSRFFTEFKTDGLIRETDHFIEILDVKRLERISISG
jgi:CRP-like cAMP-binding protein